MVEQARKLVESDVRAIFIFGVEYKNASGKFRSLIGSGDAYSLPEQSASS